VNAQSSRSAHAAGGVTASLRASVVGCAVLRAWVVGSSVLLASLVGCSRSSATRGNPPPTGSSPRTAAPPASDAAHASVDARSAPGSTPPPPQGGPIDPPAAAGEFRDAAQWLPQGDVATYTQAGAVTRSNAANLFQIIDGAAALYEEYGVRNFAKTDYRRTDNAIVVSVELYEFDAPLGAFGRYTRALADGRDPAGLQAQGVRIGGGGYQGSTQLTFWRGRVLAQISVSDGSDEPDEAAVLRVARDLLPRFGEAVAQRIPGETTEPASPLPTEGRVWGGVTYFGEAAMGLESGPGWVGHYRAAQGARYRVGVFVRANAADAQRLLQRLRRPGAADVPALGESAFTLAGAAPNGEIVVARAGSRVVVVADGVGTNVTSLDRDAKIAAARSALAAPATPAPAH